METPRSSFWTSFMSKVREQLNSNVIAGTVVVAAGGFLAQVATTVMKSLGMYLFECLCTVYVIPRNTIQFNFFQLWLSSQPNVKSNIMEVYCDAGKYKKESKQIAINNDSDDELEGRNNYITLTPSLGSIFYLWYNNTFLYIKTGRGTVDDKKDQKKHRFNDPLMRSALVQNAHSDLLDSHTTITVLGHDYKVIKSIINEGKKIHKMMKASGPRETLIYIQSSGRSSTWDNDLNYGASSGGLKRGQANIIRPGWAAPIPRPTRGIDSVSLPGSQTPDILNDCSSFLRSERWYTERGIPYRRGYLFHGKPGCGKSSLITALAGELGLDIFILSLADPSVNDVTLQTLMNNASARSILVIEDVDAVFANTNVLAEKEVAIEASSTLHDADAEDHVAVEEESLNNGLNNESVEELPKKNRGKKRAMECTVKLLTLAGILNAIDGIAGQTGRILIMTTNHKDRLDEALIRPGRVDYEIEFKEATADQAYKLFVNFYRKTATDLVDLDADDDAVLVLDQHNENIKKSAIEFSQLLSPNRYTAGQIQGVFLKSKDNPSAILDLLKSGADFLRPSAASGDETPRSVLRELTRQGSL